MSPVAADEDREMVRRMIEGHKFSVVVADHYPFYKGEIMVLSPDGREVAGVGRKPSKWDVITEEFDTAVEAVEFCKEHGITYQEPDAYPSALALPALLELAKATNHPSWFLDE